MQVKLKYILQDVQKIKINVIQDRITTSSCWIKRSIKILSVNNIVIAAAKTGNENANKKAVTNIAHINKGNVCIVIPGDLILKTVVIKLIAPIKDAAPLNVMKKLHNQLIYLL